MFLTPTVNPRVVSVCVSGTTAEHASQNARRLDLAHAIVEDVNSRWANLDAVVFPGIFLRSTGGLGPLGFKDRIDLLDASDLNEPLRAAASILARSPGALIVSGVGGPAYPSGAAGDQLCVAWNGDGVAGIGRKIFPVSLEADRFVCFEDDYSTNDRIVLLPSGHSAILCTCYDMFGVAERPGRDGIQAKAIRQICSRGGEVDSSSRAGFRATKEESLATWDSLLIRNRVSVGLASIHGFERNATAYWQKHGIATCAASLRGFAVGAAHFNSRLPSTAKRSSLAAHNVPVSHLTAGSNREPHSWSPIDAFYFDKTSALVRLYT